MKDILKKEISITNNIIINELHIIGKYNKNFKKCIGTGRFDLAFREDYIDNLKIIQDEIGFDTIRGHGILGDRLGVYQNEIQAGALGRTKLSKDVYNFKNIIRIIERLKQINITPFIELGFMPEQISINSNTVFWWQGNVCEPKDYNKWETLISKLIYALIDHFGKDEVLSWYFEVWNEPNAAFFQPESGDKEKEYQNLYNKTVTILKGIDKNIIVGGPATNEAGNEWVPRFLDYCFENNVPIDFLSHHVYTAYSREFEGEFGYLKLYNTDVALSKYQRLHDAVRNSKLPNLEIHVTEWNTSFSCIDLIHDKALNGAYIAYILTHVDHLVDSYAYWVFCDVFEEGGVPRALFHGGFGLLTENGIRKPSFYAFKFANQLYDSILYLDDNAIITNKNSDINILLFNPKYDDSVIDKQYSFNIKCKYEKAIIHTETIDEVNGNAYNMFQKIGRPRWPNKNNMDIIKKSQYPLCDMQVVDTIDGKIKFQANLNDNSIILIKITEFIDYTGEYDGLRD